MADAIGRATRSTFNVVGEALLTADLRYMSVGLMAGIIVYTLVHRYRQGQ